MKTYEEQYFGWKDRNIFERQWVLRDFRKTVGSSADEAYTRIKAMEAGKGVLSTGDYALLKALSGYWQHQYKLLKALKKIKRSCWKTAILLNAGFQILKVVVEENKTVRDHRTSE